MQTILVYLSYMHIMLSVDPAKVVRTEMPCRQQQQQQQHSCLQTLELIVDQPLRNVAVIGALDEFIAIR